MPEKMFMCVNTRTGNQCEMPEHVVEDKNLMNKMELIVKATPTIPATEVISKIEKAKSINEVNSLIENDSRKTVKEAGEEKIKELSTN